MKQKTKCAKPAIQQARCVGHAFANIKALSLRMK